MPEGIASRILRLPGYGIYGWETDEAANTLILSIRRTAEAPYYPGFPIWTHFLLLAHC
jgi:hypothetical protein